MQAIHQHIQVSFRYPVCFTTDLFAQDNPLLRDIICAGSTDFPKKILCVVDRRVTQHRPDELASIEAYFRHNEELLALVRPVLVVEGGEDVKNNPLNVTAIHDAIHASGLDRHSYVLVVGGGAVLDMAGYAAATAHRGIRLIRVPTTVLSQNDSGVGVKNSVNAYGKKNFLGTFAPPYAVLNDFSFLRTLPDRDWRSGIAEAIKVALLKDVQFFDFIERHAGQLVRRDMEAMRWVIYRCAQLHLDHIATSGDPFESGSSRPLDFGHWAAHKLEQLTNYTLRHGEAVAVGLALDSTYAYRAGLLPKRDWQRITRLISSLGLAVYVPELRLHLHDRDDPRCILNGLKEFREHLGGQLTIMLIRRIGEGIEVHEVDEQLIIASIALLENYQAAHTDGGTV
ncbi:MAG: 3-dehydroquinate synthase [Pseudomonadota bacterium]|nr:3-dehydroquinate synthase [Chloroflexota bacterium]MDP9414170.1 3-dehydroquinate synthase [Pseudomonadota bacterium]